MTIVTKTGDKGETGLFGGQRVKKSDLRIHAYGTVDELNAVIGMVRAEMNQPQAGTPAASSPKIQPHPSVGAISLDEQLLTIQNRLFRLGADLATPREGNARPPRIEPEHITELETWIDALEAINDLPHAFILPGGSKTASLLHLARTVCRRAERFVTELQMQADIGTLVTIYLNRLSDYLFMAAVQANKDEGIENVTVEY
ncbi:MAG TPA: cob(I)yrinic acid a,c-diamide adenosyltransferase [Candidatus Peribacteraceae bacterium]|nr:cob(I)yrinic acid a,c-diamide adenosyltransferase [Candidatus Peribacteraceae bacterium]